jgi:Na+-transporting NADH:ubiquinone oxidoreductase subunit F
MKWVLKISSLLAIVLVACSHATMQGGGFPHTVTVAKVEDLTHDTKRVRFRVQDQTLHFTAGQFVMLKVPKAFLEDWNKRYQTSHTQIARPYSFASSPSQLPLFDIIVKRVGPPPGEDVPPGVGSSYVHQLKVGDSVEFSEPNGKLSASPDSGRPVPKLVRKRSPA